ncbi:MAG: hypothetical protein HY283_02615 [Nitrospirae bacterium]|nr:hypothetical protein [Nitrospirota bacterium]
MTSRIAAAVVISGFLLGGCGGGGGGGGGAAPVPVPPATLGSSATGSGSAAVFTNNGVTSALTPASGGGPAVKLLTLPNTGSAVGALTVTQVSATPITTSLTTISGTSVDPAQDLGMAFDFNETKISFFKLSTQKEVGTYDTKTINTGSYSGASPFINGAVMNPANKTVIVATADGFQIVDYTNPASAANVRTIPSLAVNATTGVEIMENFAFDPALPVGGTNYAMIITGGGQGGGPQMVLVDAGTGTVYRPDAATALLFVAPTQYIDSAAIDTNYHVAILADEGTGTTFVDLNKLTLNASANTYTLSPAAAVNRITTYTKKDNFGMESTNHLVMMGGGCGGVDLVAAQLKDPSTGLGFAKEVVVTMPSGTDNTGATVTWNGWCDPHGSGAYITPSDHPTEPNRSLGLWLNSSGDHIAIIDLQGVLDGTLAGGGYDPTTTMPKDIAYFAIP